LCVLLLVLLAIELESNWNEASATEAKLLSPADLRINKLQHSLLELFIDLVFTDSCANASRSASGSAASLFNIQLGIDLDYGDSVGWWRIVGDLALFLLDHHNAQSEFCGKNFSHKDEAWKTVISYIVFFEQNSRTLWPDICLSDFRSCSSWSGRLPTLSGPVTGLHVGSPSSR
jgi:hypothetical protein